MEKKVNLDDPESIERTDPSGMLKAVLDFPNQIRRALEVGRSGSRLPSVQGMDGVVVLGMGGSGISGDVVACLAADRGLALPVFTVKGYGLPSFVGRDTLVFAVSYSGNTEETLSAASAAHKRGARLVAVASGGKLSEAAGKWGIPLYSIPAGLQPRAALGYLFVPILRALEESGLLSGVSEDLEKTAEVLDERSAEFSPDRALEDNATKRLAKDLMGYLPVIYGSEGFPSVAALRWKAQFNEMAKVPAFYNSFPELNHNETVGWLHLEEVCSRAHVVVLRDPDEHPRLEKRIGITMDLLEGSVGRMTQVCARGDTTVGKLLDVIYFGDWVSVYLAIALGQDPTPVERIEELKKRLASNGVSGDNP